MPIQISNFKVFNQVTNGTDFSLSTGTYSTGVYGNVQKVMKATFDVDISWEAQADTNNEFEIVGNTLTQEVGSFVDAGFAIGDTIDIDDPSGTPVVTNRVITFVTDDTLIFDGATATTAASTTMIVRGKNLITDFLFRFDFPSDTETADYLSRLTGRKLEWKLEGVTVGGSFEDGVWSDIKTGAKFGEFRLKHNGAISTYVQQVQIEHTFIVEPYWLDGQISNLTTIVEPDYLSGYSPLVYSFEFEPKTDINNISESKLVTQLGFPNSIGWFNEVNKTGTNNGYSVDDITYTDNATATATTAIIKDSITDVHIEVRNNGLFASGTHNLLLKVSKLPDETEYKDVTETLEETHILAYERAALGAGIVAGSDFIKNLEVTANAINPNDVIDIDFQIEYSAAQQLKIDEGDSFLITVEIGEPNSIHLIAGVGEYIVDTDVEDLFGVDNVAFYTLVDDYLGSGIGQIKGKIEDNFRAEFDFTLNLNNNALLKNFNVGLYARDSITGEYFILDEVKNNFEGVVVSSGVQEINVSTTRGWKLNTADEFGKVEITKGTLTAGVQRYSCKYGLKFTWQDYIANPNADSIFYNASEPNNNLNFQSSNYSGLNDYEIVFGIIATLSNGTTDTEYQAWSAAFQVQDYEDDSDSAITFAATIFQTFKQDLTEITPYYSADENTLLTVTFNPDSSISVTDDIRAQINLYEFENGTLQNTYQINSVNYPLAANNILQPITGQTKLKVTNNGTDVVCECQIDNDLIKTDSGFVYSVSARIFNATAAITGKQMEDGTIKLTEGGSAKQLDTV